MWTTGTTGRAGGCQLVSYGAGGGKLPGDAGVQDIHCDDHWDWHTVEEAAAADQPWPHDTMSLVANFGCEEITLERGAFDRQSPRERLVVVTSSSTTHYTL